MAEARCEDQIRRDPLDETTCPVPRLSSAPTGRDRVTPAGPLSHDARSVPSRCPASHPVRVPSHSCPVPVPRSGRNAIPRRGPLWSTISVVNYLVKVGDHTTSLFDDISQTNSGPAAVASARPDAAAHCGCRRSNSARAPSREKSRSLHSATKTRFVQDQFLRNLGLTARVGSEWGAAAIPNLSPAKGRQKIAQGFQPWVTWPARKSPKPRQGRQSLLFPRCANARWLCHPSRGSRT
jgi:hypothetical protein